MRLSVVAAAAAGRVFFFIMRSLRRICAAKIQPQKDQPHVPTCFIVFAPFISQVQ